MKTKDAVVLVTGANRGLGASLVDVLLERGAKKVYAGARDPRTVQARERVVPLALDVTDEASIAAAAAAAPDIDLLVNNAGVLASYGVLELAPSDLQRDLAVNAFGLLAATRAFVPSLVKRQGAVLNVLSVVSLGSIAPLGGYSASKAAAFSISQALRLELAPRGVRVFAAFPGGIDTEMSAHLDAAKTAPRDVALGMIDALERGDLDIYPDGGSRGVYEAWSKDPAGVVKIMNGA